MCMEKYERVWKRASSDLISIDWTLVSTMDKEKIASNPRSSSPHDPLRRIQDDSDTVDSRGLRHPSTSHTLPPLWKKPDVSEEKRDESNASAMTEVASATLLPGLSAWNNPRFQHSRTTRPRGTGTRVADPNDVSTPGNDDDSSEATRRFILQQRHLQEYQQRRFHSWVHSQTSTVDDNDVEAENFLDASSQATLSAQHLLTSATRNPTNPSAFPLSLTNEFGKAAKGATLHVPWVFQLEHICHMIFHFVDECFGARWGRRYALLVLRHIRWVIWTLVLNTSSFFEARSYPGFESCIQVNEIIWVLPFWLALKATGEEQDNCYATKYHETKTQHHLMLCFLWSYVAVFWAVNVRLHGLDRTCRLVEQLTHCVFSLLSCGVALVRVEGLGFPWLNSIVEQVLGPPTTVLLRII